MVGTQERLAKLVGIHVTALSAIENQRRFLSIGYALKISEVLACSLSDLYERVETASGEGTVPPAGGPAGT